jgi:ABC-type transport system substrate-binding protein
MTPVSKRIAIVIASALVVAAVVAAVGFSSASSAASAEGLQLDGTWTVTVTRINPPPGVAPIFKSLLSYTRGGVMIETSNTGTTRRGAALGQWERIGNNLFATSMWLFRFDPATGSSLGTQEIDRTMRLAPDGESFTAVAVIHLFDTGGNPVGDASHATEVGTRLTINPNPDQP